MLEALIKDKDSPIRHRPRSQPTGPPARYASCDPTMQSGHKSVRTAAGAATAASRAGTAATAARPGAATR